MGIINFVIGMPLILLIVAVSFKLGMNWEKTKHDANVAKSETEGKNG